MTLDQFLKNYKKKTASATESLLFDAHHALQAQQNVVTKLLNAVQKEETEKREWWKNWVC